MLSSHKKTGIVVIGSNYGDEGKGLATSYFVKQQLALGKNPLVIRFNGGAQAGHTVVSDSGKTHVFSHIGAGYFDGVPTYLSEYFVVNPKLFKREVEELVSSDHLLANPRYEAVKVIVDANCAVTTPFDILLNQLKEDTYRKNKSHHGSCGVGFGETVARHQANHLLSDTLGWRLRADDLHSECYIKPIYNRIKTEYFPMRIKELGLDVTEEILEIVNSDQLYIDFVKDCEFFVKNTQVPISGITEAYLRSTNPMLEFDTLIFEGAQGLLLDQGYGTFPYVTRSNTGIENVLRLVESYGLQFQSFDVNYVTRTYLTRHGAGPLKSESVFPEDLRDSTNILNNYQESFRYAPLSFPDLYSIIMQDFNNTRLKRAGIFKANRNLFVTWANKNFSIVNTITNSKNLFGQVYLSYSKESSLDSVNLLN